MDILLWRWSTAVQLTSAFMIAVFFVALSRSVRRPEVLWWKRAWIANLIALLVTLTFWVVQPGNAFAVRVVSGAYLAAKIAFVVMIIEGSGLVRLTSRQRWIGIALYGVAGGILLDSIMLLGLVLHGTLAIVFVAAAVVLVRRQKRRVVIWLAAGLTVRAAVALAEATAYAIANESLHTMWSAHARSFVAASSSFDTGAEWFLALGCVLVISERIQSELRDSNRELLAAQEDLRALADRDPLTGLANRRALPSILRAVQPAGAMFLFLDLDEFKEINDLHGHGVGDDCLREFAAALQACFRPDDAVVRYGGDEFVIVASGLDARAIDERLARLRGRLREAAFPRIAFSAGYSEMPPGGRPEEALRAADDAMYESRSASTSKRVLNPRRR